MALPPPPTTPPVPQRGDRTTFSSRVDAFLNWVVSVIPWMQAFLQQLTSLAAGGANSFSYRFDSSIASGDPGPGFLRLDSATQNTATLLRIDPIDSGGVDLTALVNALLQSTSVVKATVRLQDINNVSAWMILDVVGSSLSGGFYTLNVIPRASSSASPFVNGSELVVFMQRNGDRGDNGSVTMAKFSDKKATAQQGGSNIVGIQDRILNTVDYSDIQGTSLTNSIITLPAGTYKVEGRVPSYAGSENRSSLYNVTDGQTALHGSNAMSSGAAGGSTDSFITGKISLQSPKNFKIQHYFVGSNTNGFGRAVGLAGTMEIYTEITFTRIGP